MRHVSASSSHRAAVGDAAVEGISERQGDNEVLKVHCGRHVLFETGKQTVVAAFETREAHLAELPQLEGKVEGHARVEDAQVGEVSLQGFAGPGQSAQGGASFTGKREGGKKNRRPPSGRFWPDRIARSRT